MIADLRNYLDNLWHFDDFDNCLKYGCRFSDVDACTERKGSLLMLETKATGAKIPAGQKKMIKQATAHNNITWIVIFGQGNYIRNTPNKVTGFSIWYQGAEYRYPNSGGLYNIIEYWQTCANKKNFDRFVTVILYSIKKQNAIVASNKTPTIVTKLGQG